VAGGGRLQVKNIEDCEAELLDFYTVGRASSLGQLSFFSVPGNPGIFNNFVLHLSHWNQCPRSLETIILFFALSLSAGFTP
jgi:hypothetical protein